MMMRRLFCMGLILLAPPAAAPIGAATRTLKASFVKDRPADFSISDRGVRVLRYRFNRAIRGGQNPLKIFADEPVLVFEVRNEGAEEQGFALAVALFDGDGDLVGAAAQSHAGKLDPGETQEVKVAFKDVNQEVARAITIVATLETHR